jgi:predicted acyltransferase (DUF342 family)
MLSLWVSQTKNVTVCPERYLGSFSAVESKSVSLGDINWFEIKEAAN